jgi:NAD(P)H dehydrogenase (quinone)
VPEASTYAVTGATGEVGGRVAARLAAEEVPHRIVVRDPSRLPQPAGTEVAQAAYGDKDAMRAALEGVHSLFLVSASESQDRLEQHRTAVDAAREAGVQRILYLSFLGAAPDATFTLARDHWATEEHIRQSGLRFCFLRDSLYLDLLPEFVGKDGVLRGPAGDGRVAAVSRDDVADVAEAVLTGDDNDGQTFDLTGPETFSLAELAAELSRVTGREIRYENETPEQARASRAHYGAPDWQVEAWISTYTAIAAGELDVVSEAVEQLAGHPPVGLAEFLDTHPDAYRHLAG